MQSIIGETVRHSLEALGPVTICDGQERLVYANHAMRTMRRWDDSVIGQSVWITCGAETRKVVEPRWESDPSDQVLYTPDADALNGDGTSTRAAAVGMWMPYNDSMNIGRVLVSAAIPLAENSTERTLRNALAVAVQAVQLGQLRIAYGATMHAAMDAKEVLADIQVRLSHALRGLQGNPEQELYELRQLVADLSVILEHPAATTETTTVDLTATDGPWRQ